MFSEFVCPSGDGKAVKVTLQEWYGEYSIHIREYILDGDTDKWIPSNKGINMHAKYSEYLAFLVNLASKEYDKKTSTWNVSKQLEFNF